MRTNVFAQLSFLRCFSFLCWHRGLVGELGTVSSPETETERKPKTERERKPARQRQRQSLRQRGRESLRDRDRDREKTETATERKTETERKPARQRQRGDKNRETERHGRSRPQTFQTLPQPNVRHRRSQSSNIAQNVNAPGVGGRGALAL